MSTTGKIVQFSEAKKEKQETLKREYERVLFGRIMGCYTVIQKVGLKNIEVRDISPKGCAFRVPYVEGAFEVGEEIEIRFYFSNNAYLGTKVQIKRVLVEVDAGQKYWSFGAEFDTTLAGHEAVVAFVNFIEKFSLHAKEDKGSENRWYL